MRGLLVVPVCLAAAVVYACLDPDSGIRTWRELRVELAGARDEAEGLRREVERLETEIVSLQRSPFAVERAIREQLEWVKPGETLVRLPRPEGVR